MANVISSDRTSPGKHYLHTGFSDTISDSYSSPDSFQVGITWDGSNVVSSDSSADKHYLHTGFSSSISNSYASPDANPRGITWDGSNVISVGSNANAHYLHTGFSGTISNSYVSSATVTWSITWDSSNVISTDASGTTKHFLHTGFSNTLSDSYASPAAFPEGITWDGRYGNGVVAPTVTTQAVTAVDITTATGNGNITNTGGENADERGIVWSTISRADPGDVSPAVSAYESAVTESGSYGTGAFTGSLTGLTGDTPYYVRAYAHNSAGYSYGGQVTFTTDPVPQWTGIVSGVTNPARVMGVLVENIAKVHGVS